MTAFSRRVLALVLLLSIIAPASLAMTHTAQAQMEMNGAGCWPEGALTEVSGGMMTWSQAPATIIDPAQTYQAALDTSAGTIFIQLDAANAPIATNNFICLALAGYFTGTDFHRIFAGSLIQGGDPSGAGTGNPGYTIPSDPTLGPYPAGAVAMANAAPNENGSQFFITAADLTSAIPADYPVFGQVTGGIEVVQAISQGAVQAQADGEQSQPVQPTELRTVSIQSGTSESTSVGPVINTPTETPAVAVQPTAIPPTAEPTQPAAAGDPQGRPGGSTASTGAPETVDPNATGCAGFPEYQAAFDEAYTTAAIANPEALAFLMAAQSNPEANLFENITSEEAAALSGFYLSLADEIAAITPPAFASEWHAIQIEVFRELGEFTANIASQGAMFASMQAATVMGDLSSRSDAAVVAANAVCSDFATWATGEEAE